jgi:hypothetical protein
MLKCFPVASRSETIATQTVNKDVANTMLFFNCKAVFFGGSFNDDESAAFRDPHKKSLQPFITHVYDPHFGS